MEQTAFQSLSAADLDSNRSGRLTPNQRRGYADLERGVRKERMMLALILAVISALVFTSNGKVDPPWERQAFGAAFAVGAVLALYLGLFATDSLTRDLRSGAVQFVEGAIGKHTQTYHGKNSNTTTHYLEVGGRNWQVAGDTYSTAPDVGWVRLFYLPRSHKVVNLEMLPDRPAAARPVLPAAGAFVATTGPFAQPAGAAANVAAPASNAAPSAPPAPSADSFMPIAGPFAPKPAVAGTPEQQAATALIGQLAAAMRSHDREAINEARAEGAAMEHSMRDSFARAAIRPGPDKLDPRPLAEAILGRWAMGPMSMTFMPDGTMVATLPGGHEERGSWSIGPDGKLHSNAGGRDQAAEAWVAGDTLTISDGGNGLPLHRVTGS